MAGVKGTERPNKAVLADSLSRLLGDGDTVKLIEEWESNAPASAA